MMDGKGWRFLGVGVALLTLCAVASAQPEGTYSAPGAQVWDSWAVESDGVIHRYSLSASRELSYDARHENAEVRHATSTDGGKTWVDRGVVLSPRGSGQWADHVIWSGHTIVRRRGGKKEFLLFYTGRTKAGGLAQQIGLARSSDGQHFTPVEQPVLKATTKGGYDLGKGDGMIPAWRDPHVFFNPETKRWEMLFAAKQATDGKPRAVVGRAYALDDTLTRWETLPPLKLPRSYPQIELPSLVRHDGKLVLFVNTKSKASPTSRGGRAAIRAYVADALDGSWKPAYGRSDKVADHRIYGLTVFERGEPGSGRYAAVGFRPRHTGAPHTGTGLIELAWDKGGKPRLLLQPHRAPRPGSLRSLRRADGTLDWAKLRETGPKKVLGEAGGLAHFGLALFLKEVAVVVRTGDPVRIEEFFDGLLTTDFYKQYGLFVAGARVTEVAYVRYLQRYVKPRFVNGLLKTNLVLAAGMALPLLVEGKLNGRAFAISLTSLGLSTAAVRAGVAGLKWVRSLAQARKAGTLSAAAQAGRLARLGGWFYTAAELAVILYVSDEVERRITDALDERAERQKLRKAGEELLKALAAPDATPATVGAAAEAYHAVANDYRDFLYRPLRQDEVELARRLATIARRAKIEDDKQQATIERLKAYPALQKRALRRYPTLEAYAEHLAAGREKTLQQDVARVFESYAKARGRHLQQVYAGERRKEALLADAHDLDWLLTGGTPGAEGDPTAGRTDVFARLTRQRSRAALLDAFAGLSSNRLQAHEDERALFARAAQALRRAGRTKQAAALDAHLARLDALAAADRRLFQGNGLVDLKARQGAVDRVHELMRQGD